jgi:hypothetical protein
MNVFKKSLFTILLSIIGSTSIAAMEYLHEDESELDLLLECYQQRTASLSNEMKYEFAFLH